MAVKKRLVADRFRRIWMVVEEIAAHPGQTRLNLATTFHLSERQIQADLNIIRTDIGLPLVRRQGYRFRGEGPAFGEGTITLAEGQMLATVLRRATIDRGIPRGRLNNLIEKLPSLFPPHLQPIMALTLDTVVRKPGRDRHIFEALAEGLLQASWVKLHVPPGDWSITTPDGREPVIRPELLLPYLSSWYVVGQTQPSGRTRMLCLDTVEAVTFAGVDDAR